MRFDQLAVFAPIVLDTETIGVIEFRIDLSGLVASIQQYALVTAGILLLCLLAASGLSEKLQLVVLRPIQILTEGIRLIARDKDYSARVIKTSHDELGTLIDHFNAMLAEIERRDAALARHRDELEREVAVRTAELRGMVQDLARARDAAEDASRAKSQFLANMSHEIRTPMNGVLGMAELLAGTSLNERQRRFTQTIRSSAEALLAIINDILDFSKIEAGRMELSAAAFDLRDLAEDVSEFCAEGAHRKGLEIACSLPPDLPALLPRRRRQAAPGAGQPHRQRHQVHHRRRSVAARGRRSRRRARRPSSSSPSRTPASASRRSSCRGSSSRSARPTARPPAASAAPASG